MKLLSPSSTAGRGSVVALAALALLVGVGGGAAAVELRATSASPGLAGPAPVERVHAVPAELPRTDGLDPATCLAPAGTSPPTGAPQVENQAAGHTVVSFTVPPTTQVTVDEQGAVLSVATNTGQAPCTTDAFVELRPDGTAVPAAPRVRDAVLRLDLGEDWVAGVPRLLPAQR